jgi:hypothetical protein
MQNICEAEIEAHEPLVVIDREEERETLLAQESTFEDGET